MRSFNKKRHLLEAASQENSNIKAICLSETRITVRKKKLLQLDNFQLASSFCRVSRKGGGVCIFLRENIEFKERQDIVNKSVEFIFEVCAVEIPKLNLLLVTLYWPDKNREPEVFFNSLTKLPEFTSIKDGSKNILIGGDFNIDVSEASNLTARLLNLMKSYNFAKLGSMHTRVTKTTSTCIDLVFSNMHHCSISTETKEYGLSDHQGILIGMPGELPEDKKPWYTEKRIFSAPNLKSFKEELQKINWLNFINPAQSINENYNAFHDKINAILQHKIPVTKIKIKNKNKSTWLTKG